jgi:hypothetical protein
MLVYLDTKDLIDLFENSSPCTSDHFNKLLKANGHELVLSFLNVLEVSAPLLSHHSKTNVMRLLNTIESFPIKYIAGICKSELSEAYRAFRKGREYEQILPFVRRFDETAEDGGTPPTKLFINFGLADAVFMLWTEDPSIFSGYKRHTDLLRSIIDADRSLINQPSLRENFVKTIGLHLQIERMTIPGSILRPFAEWIFDKPERCPSIRLGYEVYHKLVKNTGDIPKDGDIPDLGHLSCVPYVDFITLDRRMCSYANQVSIALGFKHKTKIYKKAEELIAAISSGDYNSSDESVHTKSSF